MTHLLTLLKFAAPVVGVTAVGGGIFYVAVNTPKQDKGKPLPGVYLLVKGETNADTSSSTGTLTKTANSKTTKNYHCELTLSTAKTFKDEACGLYKLNSLTGSSVDSIDLNKKMFDDTNLATEKSTITANSHHILRVSRAFYKHLSASKTTNKAIKLAEKDAAGKHFGTVKEVVNLNIKNTKDLDNPNINLFLARVKTAQTSGTYTKPFSCKLSDTLTAECNLYKLSGEPTKSNALTKANLSAATVVATHSDIAADNYVIVELTNSTVMANSLKNYTITIKQALSDATNTAEVIYDQALLGKASKTTSESIIYPLTAKTKTFLVKKDSTSSGQTAFDDITTTSNKNYRCQFTKGTDVNYDNSCELKSFPTPDAVHQYSAITAQTGFTGVSNGLNSKDHFLLSVDSNKLFNLSPDWSKDNFLKVTTLSTASAAKSQSFTLLQEVTPNKATGKTDLVFVKYKSTETLTNVSNTGKCAFVSSDNKGVACSLFKATITSNLPTTAFAAHSAGTQITEAGYFALKFDGFRNIKDFDGSNLYFYSTHSNTTTKITFDIVATMGGDIGSGKISYFLEPTRSTIAGTR